MTYLNIVIMQNRSTLQQKLKSFLIDRDIQFEENVDLKRRTWIHRGGVCSLFINPKTKEELLFTAKFVYDNKIPFEILGHTSNTYFKNEYNPFVVITTAKVDNILDSKSEIVCDCGVSVRKLSKQMLLRGVKGFEGLIDLPGTVAASVYNNSSCFNCSISNLLISVDLLNEQGQLETLFKDDLHFSFRSSDFKMKLKRGVILSVKLKKEQGNFDILNSIAERNHQRRVFYQQGKAYNLGSCFNNFEKKSLHCLILKSFISIYRFYAILVRKPLSVRKANEIKYMLSLAGYKSLSPYISSKSINCFMWVDENADKFFDNYCAFMKKMYPNSKLEIEIKF